MCVVRVRGIACSADIRGGCWCMPAALPRTSGYPPYSIGTRGGTTIRKVAGANQVIFGAGFPLSTAGPSTRNSNRIRTFFAKHPFVSLIASMEFSTARRKSLCPPAKRISAAREFAPTTNSTATGPSSRACLARGGYDGSARFATHSRPRRSSARAGAERQSAAANRRKLKDESWPDCTGGDVAPAAAAYACYINAVARRAHFLPFASAIVSICCTYVVACVRT